MHGILALYVVIAIGTAILLYAFVVGRKSNNSEVAEVLQTETEENMSGGPDGGKVVRRRLAKEYIPKIELQRRLYREIFNDSNYVQLTAARINGIDPKAAIAPSLNERLVRISSTEIYRVDTMYHSEPYLVPESALLLQQIAIRFNEVMEEEYKSHIGYKPIVTSALRTEASERRLRRVNRNATDTSCHVYGTTFDLSSQRFENRCGRDTVVEECRCALARALYELKYEGLCYVKYERGSCFHITMISTQYEGDYPSRDESYFAPKASVHAASKHIDCPPYRRTVVSGENKAGASGRAMRNENGKNRRNNTHSSHKEASLTTEAKPHSDGAGNQLTERERMSLDQFERKY